jgi:hypothetical protein
VSAARHPRLFDLLPAIHRVRDAERDGELEALLAVLQEELDRLRDDVDGLYDNWFIETCDAWAVPYLGDVLGVRGLVDLREAGLSQRGLVANTLAYRRRKGTAFVLEQLAFDMTGWTARAVELFQLLGWTQNVNHVRAGAGGTADLHDPGRLELLGGGFDPFARTADVRHVDNGRGRYNIPNVAIFLWRLQSHPVERATPRADPAHAGRFTFDPLGRDVPLFSRQRREAAIEHLAEEVNVEQPLRRRALRDELLEGPLVQLDEDDPALRIHLDGSADPVPTAELRICDLSDPARGVPAGATAAIDPQLGRLAVLTGAGAPGSVEVSWSYGFPGELGGGPYDRRATVADALRRAGEATRSELAWQRGVSREAGAGAPELDADLTTALAAWNATVPDPPIALIAVMDSRTLEEDIAIDIPAGCWLILAAGEWRAWRDPRTGLDSRPLGRIAARGVRPHLRGSITVTGGAGGGGALVLDGLLVEGTVTVSPGALGLLRLSHCTVGGLTVEEGADEATRNVGLEVELDRAACGPVDVAEHVHEVRLAESIVDAGDDAAQALLAPATRIDRSTVLGRSVVRSVDASESIFTGPLDVERRQTGCVRFSYLAPGSRAPRRYRCQPGDDALVVPAFTSRMPGRPAYAQLARHCPREIAHGAEDGGEMGAWHLLHQPQRVGSLRGRLDEYLRFGLEAGVFFAN